MQWEPRGRRAASPEDGVWGCRGPRHGSPSCAVASWHLSFRHEIVGDPPVDQGESWGLWWVSSFSRVRPLQLLALRFEPVAAVLPRNPKPCTVIIVTPVLFRLRLARQVPVHGLTCMQQSWDFNDFFFPKAHTFPRREPTVWSSAEEALTEAPGRGSPWVRTIGCM